MRVAEPIRVFIVEDEPRIARFLQIELEHEGFQAETEANGRRAFERIVQENHDIVLLDVMLPDMDGMEICRRVREVSSIPIIMLTARDEIEDKVNGLDIGADDYMTKP
ncbi:MAG: response regulator, partial [Selenomonadaceae bacterium]|nr:response regulator [Selenomonadaceae bacterium]